MPSPGANLRPKESEPALLTRPQAIAETTDGEALPPTHMQRLAPPSKGQWQRGPGAEGLGKQGRVGG